MILHCIGFSFLNRFIMKKILRGKILIKNFSNTKGVFVTTISPSKAQPKWLFIHFCSLAKMIFLNYDQLVRSTRRKVFAFLKRIGAKAGLVFAKWNKNGQQAKRSKAEKSANSFRAKGWGFQFVAFLLQIEISFFTNILYLLCLNKNRAVAKTDFIPL